MTCSLVIRFPDTKGRTRKHYAVLAPDGRERSPAQPCHQRQKSMERDTAGRPLVSVGWPSPATRPSTDDRPWSSIEQPLRCWWPAQYQVHLRRYWSGLFVALQTVRGTNSRSSFSTRLYRSPCRDQSIGSLEPVRDCLFSWSVAARGNSGPYLHNIQGPGVLSFRQSGVKVMRYIPTDWAPSLTTVCPSPEMEVFAVGSTASTP